MISLDRWLTLLLLVLFASMLAIGLQYPAEARLVPVTVSLLGLVLCLVQLAFDVGSARQAYFAERFHAAPKLGRPDLPVDDPEEPVAEIAQRELLMWGYFLAFVAAVLAFGFYVAAPATIFSHLWRRAQVNGHMRWSLASPRQPSCIAYSAGFSGSSCFRVSSLRLL
jgi:hypothetical protein